jgi:hypothetical protein
MQSALQTPVGLASIMRTAAINRSRTQLARSLWHNKGNSSVSTHSVYDIAIDLRDSNGNVAVLPPFGRPHHG